MTTKSTESAPATKTNMETTAPPTPVDAIPLANLIEMRRKCEEELARVKYAMSAVDDEIANRTGRVMEKRLEKAGKDHGSFKLELGEGVFVQATIAKTVSWDSDRLAATAASMDDSDARAIFRAKLTVSEETFAELSEMDHPCVPDLIEARTVKLGKLSVKLL